jgi:ATP-dependent DNA helicase RecG
MNLSELHERIARWENLHTEFKDWPVHPDDLAASFVAFANTDGGQLILGVTNSRVIVGVEDSDRVTHNVDSVAINNCEPPITVIQEVFYPGTSPHDRPVVVVNIPKGDMRP